MMLQHPNYEFSTRPPTMNSRQFWNFSSFYAKFDYASFNNLLIPIIYFMKFTIKKMTKIGETRFVFLIIFAVKFTHV